IGFSVTECPNREHDEQVREQLESLEQVEFAESKSRHDDAAPETSRYAEIIRCGGGQVAEEIRGIGAFQCGERLDFIGSGYLPTETVNSVRCSFSSLRSE